MKNLDGFSAFGLNVFERYVLCGNVREGLLLGKIRIIPVEEGENVAFVIDRRIVDENVFEANVPRHLANVAEIVRAAIMRVKEGCASIGRNCFPKTVANGHIALEEGAVISAQKHKVVGV